jgi:uncharacterized membrane protein YvbJ
MKCPECGTEVAPDEKFCGNCGAPLEGSAPEAPSTDETAVTESTPGDETVVDQAPAIASAEPEDLPDLPAPEIEMPPPPPAQTAEKASNKTVWIIVAIVVVLLCCCCTIALVAILANTDGFVDALEDIAMVLPQALAII